MPQPVIELRAVTKVYPLAGEAVRALRGVDLRIAAGEFVAIMGASGSGKSTLMHILGCLDTPSDGAYLLDGVDTRQLGRTALAHVRNRKLGFVFQAFNLLSRTSALENVELPLVYNREVEPAAARVRAREALKAVGLEQREQHSPAQLSGGQQQRVAIARAIVNNPLIVLADEPTGNLDTAISEEIMALLQRLNARGITVVLVTHEPDIAQFAGRTVTFRDGAIVADAAVALPRVARMKGDAA